MPAQSFVEALHEQIANEFGAEQQYIACAVYYESQTLPQLANLFYKQAIEERNHAMMMLGFLLDRGGEMRVPGVAQPVNNFKDFIEPIALALEQEKSVTAQIEALFRAARTEGDVLGEQFMLWFLKEQVEEVAAMNTLLTIAQRAGEDWFQIEDHLAREAVGDGGNDASAPAAAGGTL